MSSGFVETVQVALAALPTDPKDAPARKLAARYAQEIDNGKPIGDLGPKLLAVLEALGLTPRARAAALKGGKDDAPDPGRRDPADELRARRAARFAGAPPVDAAAP